MNTINEDYCSFEVAKLLKDKGFVGECSRFYMPNGYGIWKYEHYHDFDISKRIECPTLQMACKWLREVYNVVIEINSIWIVGFGYNYIARIVVEGESKKCLKHYNYYEEAVEAAIKYVLENLI